MAVTTLIPADIIQEGADSGLELTITSGGNAVMPREPLLHTGKSAAAVAAVNTANQGINTADKTARLATLNSKLASDEMPLGGTDFAYRLAVAKTSARFDFLAAYAYRSRGNYYAGSNNTGYYSEGKTAATEQYHDDMRNLAAFWQPGGEIINTSSEMGSLLLKSNWRVDTAQKLGFNYRHSNMLYGEILPSRSLTAIQNFNSSTNDQTSNYIQWPLAEVNAQAYNLEYRNKPNDNRWLDLHANLWRTHTLGHTNTRGGFPNQLDKKRTKPSLDTDLYQHKGTGLIVNTAVIDSTHTRNGITLSNTMDLSSALVLTLGANFQHEKLASRDGKYYKDRIERGGRRQQWGGNLSLAWQPNERLKISTGMTYSAYWSFDDRLKSFIDAGGAAPLTNILDKNITYNYTTGTLYTPEQRKQFIDNDLKKKNTENTKRSENINLLTGACTVAPNFFTPLAPGWPSQYKSLLSALGLVPDKDYKTCATLKEFFENNMGPTYTDEQIERIQANPDGKEAKEAVIDLSGDDITNHNENTPIPLLADAAGKYAFASHPCFNGEVKQAIANKTGDDKSAQITKCSVVDKTYESEPKAEKLQDHGWVPHFAASYQFTPYSRGYVKYSEFIRYPSMFESMYGFSAALGPDGLKPEHAYNWEASYVHDLTQWLTTAEYADVKLAYYANLTKGVSERGISDYFTNMNEKKIRGVELNLRYDGGRLFSNIGVNYVLQNEICDENFAVDLSKNSYPYRVPICFAFGMPSSGYQLARATPKLSADWALGARLLDRRLELGSRVKYYSRHVNADLDRYLSDSSSGVRVKSFGWNNTLLVDAYANYNVNARLQVEFAGANLTDQYYLDPLTRSPMPAPGRTLKLNLNMQL